MTVDAAPYRGLEKRARPTRLIALDAIDFEALIILVMLIPHTHICVSRVGRGFLFILKQGSNRR